MSVDEQLPELVALGVLDLAAEEVADILCASSQTTRSQRQSARRASAWTSSLRDSLSRRAMTRFVLEKPVARAGRFELVVGENVERQVEATVQLVLPLLDQAAGAHDQAPLQVAARDQLLDQQPGHDRLAGAGVVGQQEAQRLARQHRLVDRRDLVRQRLDHEVWTASTGSNRCASRMRCASETRRNSAAVAVEAPRPALLDDLERASSCAIEQFVGDLAGGGLVRQFERLGAEPLHADDCDQRVGQDWRRMFDHGPFVRRFPRPPCSGGRRL